MILRIYDYFSKHKPMLFASLALITIVLVASVVRLSFKEDISDFLPVGTSDRESLAVYQNISGANRLFVVFRNTADADSTISQIDYFEERVRERDTLGWCSDLTTKFDLDKLAETSEFVYGNIPILCARGWQPTARCSCSRRAICCLKTCRKTLLDSLRRWFRVFTEHQAT